MNHLSHLKLGIASILFGTSFCSTPLYAKEYCLPAKQLQLQGISIFSKKAQVLKTFGAPLKSSKGTGEGTGSYPITTLEYDGLRIVIDETKKNQWVDDLTISTAKYVLPSGIKIGMDKSTVSKLLGNPGKDSRQGDTWNIPMCDDYAHNQTVGPVFMFDAKNRLKTIRFEYVQP